MKTRTSTDPGRKGETRSPWVADVQKPEVEAFSETALETVRLVAAQAKGETSMAVVRTCVLPKMVEACAVRKAITTPEPGPTSRTNGAGEGEEEGLGEAKRDERKAVSEGDESVSSRRKESSAGS